MRPMKTRLLGSTVIPAAVAAGVAVVAIYAMPVAVAQTQIAAHHEKKGCNPCAAKKGCNPCAAKRGCNPCAAKKGCNPCNPCAAKKGCNPCAAKRGCNPCAAKKGCNPCAAKRGCNPCNPCAARGCNPCNPCNPCAAGATAYSSKCVVPRLASANPCAAKRGCNPCSPCAAKKACKPCNPCAAKKGCGPCNPCAAKRGCNPCAAKKGCNPCAANPCNPCGPCGAAAPVELTAAESASVYDCLKGEMKTAYAKSGNLWAKWFLEWKAFSKQPYVSGTHGNRYVSNYASKKARDTYGKYEKSGKMPQGGILAKDSFTVGKDGRVSVGPLFLMEKMGGNFNKASGNWRYTLIMPNGQVVGTTGGHGDKNVKFCITCHITVAEDQDSMFFLPEELRVN